ncbi:MerR family transcriptional regulator [Streptomyces acidicola]|uniref:MerR family transcriptional regulator n=1 Tax=Streptomyces acidicola TaxID=2596892 RepID=A0A5N8WM10_9ACTN|nr:MerR family transcriptional regulator [Streptomyces acidicola]MPY48483.1 MerR family transcriptional regulator [Streptomyces acidicola]
MNDESVGVAYRIEDLAHHSGATVRTIRAYQNRGLLPSPERQGRANVYSDAHLASLHQIAGLLDRGYTLTSIKELLEAWDSGRGLGGILGLVAEVDGPCTDAEAAGAVTLVQRLRPLERRTVDAEETRSVPIPAATMRAVEELVGPARAAEFVAIAAEREVQARALDSISANRAKLDKFGEMT